tara:strand:+ start:237 stop:614 length:378 start_codon:yes stop_codon:yes gene_type:complete
MSTIKANTLLHSDGSTTTQPSIPALDKRMAKAWCLYQGNTNTLSNSYNVSSVTDSATGTFIVNYTTSVSNALHITLASTSTASGAARNIVAGARPVSTSTADLLVETSDGLALDTSQISFIAFDN